MQKINTDYLIETGKERKMKFTKLLSITTDDFFNIKNVSESQISPDENGWHLQSPKLI
jgi:hypothetical protein